MCSLLFENRVLDSKTLPKVISAEGRDQGKSNAFYSLVKERASDLQYFAEGRVLPLSQMCNDTAFSRVGLTNK